MGVQTKLDEISVNLDQQSTLARLLANENISVIHGAYKTAWFDPEKRVLALPIWKNKGKAVYDLLTGHEVGHALYTPAIGWHDAVTDIEGAPKAYLNVLEDVRIERKVQTRYPGLLSQFQKAYKIFSDEDFFGIRSHNLDVNTMILIDRINLKAKLGQNIEVPFDIIGRMFFAKAQQTETFEEVVALAIEIYQYQKALNENSKTGEGDARNNEPIDLEDPQSAEDEDVSNQNDYEKPEPVTEPEQEQEPLPEDPIDEKTGRGKGSADKIQEELDKDDFTEKPSSIKEEDEAEISLESLTDKAFRDNEKHLLADNLADTMVYTINKIKRQGIEIDYKEYYSAWKSDLSAVHDYAGIMIADDAEKLKDSYSKFRSDTDMAAAYMAKEFELRKAAYQYSRSSIQKTGVINTNKLHSYKYNEDIFLKSTKLANYKNHGMMMFIDFSGSMQDNIGATIRQVLNLTTFCRMIDVPYEVYAFTTRISSEDEDDSSGRMVNFKDFSDCEIVPQNFNLINLMSSRMTRSEYQEGQRMLWNLSMAWDGKMSQYYISRMNHLHSTPLNTCIVYATSLVKAFKLKNNVEKMTTMFLTDGASDSFQVRMTDAGDEHRTSHSGYRGRSTAIVRIDGHAFKVRSINGPEITSELLKVLKKTTQSTVIGFFLSEYRNQAINKVMSELNSASYIRNKEKFTQQMNKGRCLIEDDIFGYDRYFGLCSKYIDLVEDEFGELVEDGASKGKIKTAFAKMTKQRRVNRILLNAFVDTIA